MAGALLIALCAQLTIVQTGQTIPLIADFRIQLVSSPVPITGQTFAVLLVGGALGLRRGVLSVGLYLVLGLLLPFYSAGSSGLDTFVSRDAGGTFVFGATGGYLIGFLLAAAVTGRLAELGWDRHILGAIAAMFLGNVAIYLVGVPWLAMALPAQYDGIRLADRDRVRADAVHHHRRDQAAPRGGELPGRVVGRRAAVGRALRSGPG